VTSPSAIRVAARYLASRGEEFVPQSEFKYLGVFLDGSGWRTLLRWFQRTSGEALLSEMPRSPHLTIKFDPSHDDIEDTPLGKKVRLKVVGWAADEKGQAVEVVPLDGVRSVSAVPHITIANAPGYRASYSNTLLKKAKGRDPEVRYGRDTGPTLKGEIRGFRWEE